MTGNEGFLTLQNEQNYAAETDINAYDIRFGSAQLVSDEANIQMSSLLCALKLDIILGTRYQYRELYQGANVGRHKLHNR